jgi:hypothetical protein
LNLDYSKQLSEETLVAFLLKWKLSKK